VLDAVDDAPKPFPFPHKQAFEQRLVGRHDGVSANAQVLDLAFDRQEIGNHLLAVAQFGRS